MHARLVDELEAALVKGMPFVAGGPGDEHHALTGGVPSSWVASAVQCGTLTVHHHGSLVDAAVTGVREADAPSAPLHDGSPRQHPAVDGRRHAEEGPEHDRTFFTAGEGTIRYGEGDSYEYGDGDDDDDDSDDSDLLWDRGAEIEFSQRGKDGAVTGGSRGALQPREHALSGLYNKIRVEKFDGPQGLSDAVSNKIMSSGKKVEAARIRRTDKSDRATTEQVSNN